MGKLRTGERGQAGAGRLIIALSGLPGSGKTTLARAIAIDIGGTVVAFSDHVRRLAALNGLPASRAELQNLGEDVIAANPAAFLADAIAPAGDDWTILILDGLRHLSLLRPLRELASEREARFLHVHLEIPAESRLARLVARGVPMEEAEKVEHHRVEADARSGLAERANVRLDASLPLEEEVRVIVREVS